METSVLALRYNSEDRLEQLLRIRDGERIVDEWRVVPDKWDTVDWSKSSSQISAEIFEPYNRVRSMRKMRCKVTIGPMAARGIDVAKIDWTKNNQELSREYGIDPGSVGRERHMAGVPNASKLTTKEKVDAIDWAVTRDVDAGRIMGVTRERARQLRNVYRKPQCALARCSLVRIRISQLIAENRPKFEAMTINDAVEVISRQFDCSKQTAKQAIRHCGLALKKGRHPNEKYVGVNFDLPNKLLGAIWGACPQTMATKRMNSCAGPDKWSFKKNSKQILGADFFAAMEAEIRKAQDSGVIIDRNLIDRVVEQRVAVA